MARPCAAARSFFNGLRLAEDLFVLAERFKNDARVNGMSSYMLLVRVLREQCIVSRDSDGKEEKVTVRESREVKASSLQNPSDPDAGYDSHKGKGYQVQLVETYSVHDDDDDDKTQRPLSLITYAEAEPAHYSDAKAVEPAIEHLERQGHTPERMVADTLYGSDHNVEHAKEHGINLVSPTSSALRKDPDTNLDSFEFDDSNEVVECPAGHAPYKIHNNKKKGRVSACFRHEHGEACDKRNSCITKSAKKGRYLRYQYKDVRLLRRRAYENTAEFHEEYRYRAGIEATNSELARRTGIKRLRVRGRQMVEYCVKLKAAGLNIIRAAAYQRKKGGNTPYCAPFAWVLT